jgi:formate dehydrogenase iron-sulfur subunit
VDDAYLYGAPGTPGATGDLRHLHAFFLLLDRPEVYNLPAAPSRGANRVLPSLLSGVATAILLTAVSVGLLAAMS